MNDVAIKYKSRLFGRSRDAYRRWWDSVNSFSVIVIGILVMLVLIYIVANPNSFVLKLIDPNEKFQRGQILATLVSVLVSGIAVAFIWAYSDTIKRWSTCNLAKSDLVLALSAIKESGVFSKDGTNSQSSTLPLIVFQRDAGNFFRNHSMDFIYLNPSVFEAMNRLFSCLDAYQELFFEQISNNSESGYILKCKAELAMSTLSACVAHRQLGGSHPSILEVSGFALEFLTEQNIEVSNQELINFQRYFRE